jgi:hypothetical protein
MQQIQFVGEDHFDVITSIVANTHHFDAAVAYWSKGSATASDLTRAPAGSTLVCNLFSPDCDPNEVETLFTLKRFNLKRHDGLHAKVYLADDAVCVGSLTTLNTELRFVKDITFPHREANLICRDPDVIRDVRIWIDKIIAESKPIEKWDIDEAKQRRRQDWEGLVRELIDLKEEAIKKAKLVVLVWAGDPSDQVKKQVKKFPEHSLPRHDWFIDLPEHAIGYPYGSHAICFKLSDDRRRLGKCEGIFEIMPSSNPYHIKNAGRREVVIWRLQAVESRTYAIGGCQFIFGKRSVDAIRNKVIERERGLKLKSVFDSGKYGFLSWEPLHTLLRARVPVASS